MATGNIPASMMKPIPRRITANLTSVKVKPWRRSGSKTPNCLARDKPGCGGIGGGVEHDQLAHVAPIGRRVGQPKAVGSRNELAMRIEEDHAAISDRGWIRGIVGVVPDITIIGARPAARGNGGV